MKEENIGRSDRTMTKFLLSILGLMCFMTGLFATSPSLNLTAEISGNEHSRMKRSRPCQDKFKIVPDHTACLDRSSQVLESGLLENEAVIIVDEHNKVRKEVSAMDMVKMSWDQDVASIAQRWAENCEINHDQNYNRYDYGRFSVGQNLAWSNYKMTWSQAMKGWSDEKVYYTYGSSVGAGNKAIGHYTQMAWAESTKIGCGYANCAGTHYYVCNYAPAGNSDIAYPYKRGRQCADCPSTCSDGLCDCGNRVCFNGGDMDLDKCTCRCNKDLSFYFQPSCSLNCTEIVDPYWCSQFAESYCSKYTNVPQECPKKCKWCPAAGATFGSETGEASYTKSVLITVLLSVLSCFVIVP